MNTNKKDNIVLLIILYFSCFLFWLSNRNNVHSGFDMYIFVGVISVMLVLPLFVLEIRARRDI